MSRHEELCPHCRAKAAGDDSAAAVTVEQEIELPEVPTPIRVHQHDMPPFDCTLHPDGTLTAVLGGELRRNAMDLAAMRERNWEHTHIEFNPPPLESEPEPQAAPVAEQIPLAA